jgi:hypothetical protein
VCSSDLIYTLILKVPDKTAINLRGCFYDFDNYFDEWGKRLFIENISLTYINILV